MGGPASGVSKGGQPAACYLQPPTSMDALGPAAVCSAPPSTCACTQAPPWRSCWPQHPPNPHNPHTRRWSLAGRCWTCARPWRRQSCRSSRSSNHGRRPAPQVVVPRRGGGGLLRVAPLLPWRGWRHAGRRRRRLRRARRGPRAWLWRSCCGGAARGGCCPRPG